MSTRRSTCGHRSTDTPRPTATGRPLPTRAWWSARWSRPRTRRFIGFLDRAFQLDWVHDQGWAMDHGMPVSDVLLLVPAGGSGGPVAARKIAGFATIHQRGNAPLFGPRFWEDLLEPSSGGLGPIGVAERLRGRGLGRALLAVALDTLHSPRRARLRHRLDDTPRLLRPVRLPALEVVHAGRAGAVTENGPPGRRPPTSAGRSRSSRSWR